MTFDVRKPNHVVPSAQGGRDPSTPQGDSLRASSCCAQDDKGILIAML